MLKLLEKILVICDFEQISTDNGRNVKIVMLGIFIEIVVYVLVIRAIVYLWFWKRAIL